MGKYILIIIGAILCGAFTCVSAQTATVLGKLTDENGEQVSFALVQIKDTGIGAYSDEKGAFKLEKVPFGTQEILVDLIGYEPIRYSFELTQPKLFLPFVLKERMLELAEVEVAAQRESQIVKASGFSVEVLESGTFEGLSKDVNFMLGSVSGVNIRSSGGLGADFELSLNGLSGNQVRYFMDGMPMANFGSALTLNNFPSSLIDHIEVYKGVVPVHLGGDALGGAINVVTATHKQAFLEANYSYGSFNTHRAALSGQWVTKKGFFTQLSSFYNYADNDFLMEAVPLYDLELGNSLGDISVKRFHDTYRSAAMDVKVGVFEKKYADELAVSMSYAANNKAYQHPDNNIKVVFGAFQTQGVTKKAGLHYQKVFADVFDVKAQLVVAEVLSTVIDTSTLRVNWNQEVIKRVPTDERGELFDRRSYFVMTDGLVNGNMVLRYQLSPVFHTTVSYTKNVLNRRGYDKVDQLNQSFTTPSTLDKEILGVSFEHHTPSEKLESYVFLKQYWFEGEMLTYDYADGEVLTRPSLSATGYGVSSTYRFSPLWVLKGSFEKAYRLPESYEILGSGVYVLANPALLPENSLNANVGLINKFDLPRWYFTSDINLFLRSTNNFIRYVPQGPFGTYQNVARVKSQGVEWSGTVNYDKRFSISPNITYQSITDQSPLDEGLPNVNYKSRIPNVPYLFGNLLTKAQLFQSKGHQFSLAWNSRYVHQFFLNWEHLGSTDSKNIIPSQWVQDMTFIYQFQGLYTAAISVTNFTDEIAFDHFRIQKPRRGISIQLKYRLVKPSNTL